MTTQSTTTYLDPICGMQVDKAHAAGHSVYNGEDYYFCSAGCKAKFDRNPGEFVKARSGRLGGCCGG